MERIDAVFAFRYGGGENGQHHFHLNVLARHVQCSRSGAGVEATERFLDACLEVAERSQPVKRLICTAEAHRENAALHRMLLDTNWRRGEGQLRDPDYEKWELIVDFPENLLNIPTS